MAKTSKAQLKAAEKYLAKQRQVVIRLDREKDADILAWLEWNASGKCFSMQSFIKELIESDMKKAEVYSVEDESGNEIERDISYDEAYECVESYERDDVRDGTYVSGSYYIRNTATGYCERIYT